MRAIVAIDENGVMGLNGGLPWSNKDDMNFFTMMTLGQDVIMGRKTYESLRIKPLPHRSNIILSRTLTPTVPADFAYIVERTPKLISYTYNQGIVIGGLETYQAMWPYISTWYVSHIPGSHEGDTVFPTTKLYTDYRHSQQFSFGNLSINVLTKN